MTRAGDRYRLDDRVAVITGGSSGLGVDLAITFADAGAKVVICGRRAPMLEQTRARVEAAGGQCLAVAADVSNVEQCEAVVNGARERFGSVDVLVNNAGVGAREGQSTAAACGDFA